jgi:hypothetical protein
MSEKYINNSRCICCNSGLSDNEYEKLVDTCFCCNRINSGEYPDGLDNIIYIIGLDSGNNDFYSRKLLYECHYYKKLFELHNRNIKVINKAIANNPSCRHEHNITHEYNIIRYVIYNVDGIIKNNNFEPREKDTILYYIFGK